MASVRAHTHQGRRQAVAMVMGVALLAIGCAEASDGTERSVTGVITAPGELGAVHLRPGDCIRDAISAEVGALVGVPCQRAHRAQVVSVGTSDEYDFPDPAAIDELCIQPVDEIGTRLLDRDDLPQIDVAVLFTDDGNRAVCVMEFAEAITEDLVRRAA